MSIRPYQQAYDVVIRMMAETLILPPAVEPYRLADCVNRWREQRVAEICINEFGDDARAEARRLLQVAEEAQRGPTGALADDRRRDRVARSLGHPLAGDVARVTPIPPAEASMGRVSGKAIREAHHAA